MSAMSLLLWSLLATSQPAPVLLTGTLQSSERQNVVSPMSENWRVQVQWLKPEEEPVRAGDLVAVFDAGSLQSTIERLKTQVDTARDQLKKLQLQHDLTVMEARYEWQRRSLLQQKAGIDAAVPRTNLSEYDYELYQLDYRRAETATEQALKALQLAEVARDTELTKQKLQIEQQLDELQDAEHQLSDMSVTAEVDGAISYGLHPWYGTPVFSGMTAQPGWLIAQVHAENQLLIEAWVHETDMQALQQARQFTALFDSAPDTEFNVQLQALAQQGERRRQLGQGLYFRAEFYAEQLPIADARLGLGLLIKVMP